MRTQAAALVTSIQALEELQAAYSKLEARLKELERRLEKGGPRGVPGIKAEPASPQGPPKERKRRTQGFARPRSTPTQTVDHAVDQCPDCGTPCPEDR